MPWKDTTVLDDRMKFVALCLDKELSMTELCRVFGISRKTGYKLLQRYKTFGPAGLEDIARAPHSHPNAVSEQVQQSILSMKAAHPTWGPRKLLAVLQRDADDVCWPAASTTGAILARHGLTIPRKRRYKSSQTPRVLTQPGEPNDVWCADFKGHFALGNGTRCHPLTITDAYSRSIIRCQALTRPCYEAVVPIWLGAFKEYGLPNVIRTDNGQPFASTGLTGLSALSVWWIKLGIRPERTTPGRPQQNGQHERMHRTLKAEATKPPQMSIPAQQKVFERFSYEYNHIRPHEALGQLTPGSIYVSSQRSYPVLIPEMDYPSGMTVRRVRSNGEIRWRSHLIFLSEALRAERVGLDQIDDSHWAVYFGPVPVAILDDQDRSWLAPKVAQPIIQQLLKENPI